MWMNTFQNWSCVYDIIIVFLFFLNNKVELCFYKNRNVVLYYLWTNLASTFDIILSEFLS